MTGTIPVNKIHESDLVLVFHHTKPSYKDHIVVIPKECILDICIICYHDGLSDITRFAHSTSQDLSKEVTLSQTRKHFFGSKKGNHNVLWNSPSREMSHRSDVFELIKNIRQKGITEDTFNYDHNYGYDDNGKLLEIDVGSFRKGEKYIQSEKERKKMCNNQTSNRLKRKSEELYTYHLEKCNELYGIV